MSKSQVDLSEVHLEDLLDVHLEDLLSADAEQVLEVLLWVVVVVVLRPDWLMKLAAFLAWAVKGCNVGQKVGETPKTMIFYTHFKSGVKSSSCEKTHKSHQ